MARAGMNPKALQYLMGHAEIGVTMNVYTHLGEDDAREEMIKIGLIEQEEPEIHAFQLGWKPSKPVKNTTILGQITEKIGQKTGNYKKLHENKPQTLGKQIHPKPQ